MMAQRPAPRRVHPLSGAVVRRMELFGNFADRAVCAADRPDRVVEMVKSPPPSPDAYQMV